MVRTVLNRIYKLAVIVFLFLGILSPLYAQNSDSEKAALYNKYYFINKSLNRIENDSVSLDMFYQKLMSLDLLHEGRVNITHIGDSHLQADHFTGTIRQNFQHRFGNAGRGFIFPYNVAKTNEPSSFTTLTKTKWDAKRNVFVQVPLPIGIGGYTIQTDDSCASINLTVENQPGLGYAFTRFTLFQERELNNYDISVCDSLNNEFKCFKFLDKAKSLYSSEVTFDKPMRQININCKVSDTANQRFTRIYGMLLENDSSGVLYNMIGVNGAKYRHYNKSEYFIEQLSYLHTDLFIISMGTNEAYYPDFNKVDFYNHIDTLVTNIKLSNPYASILLTTPPDSYRRNGRERNPYMKQARLAIINYCLQNNIAYWDLYEVMGGYGSMYKWYVNNLAVKDKVHFNSKGYKIQANLFFDALMEGYEDFKQTKVKP